MNTLIPRSALLLATLGFANGACALPIFDFGSTTRTFLSTGPAVPTIADFAPLPPNTEALFTVGNLLNGCGLWNAAAIGSRSGTGTGCGLKAHNVTNPWDTLARSIDYTDSFTLATATTGLLQIIVKLGHPEGVWPNQKQHETFDVFLEGAGSRILLTNFLDDVSGPLLEDDAYYRYVYDTAQLPAGTWSPVFEARSGSIEFLTQLSAALPDDSHVPEPGTLALMAPAFALAGWFTRRRETPGRA
jgi:hypothetical protein